jgi:phosphatidylglycerol:prolipoprotein diacylglycerol transferase
VVDSALVSLLAAIGWTVLPRIDLGLLSISPHGLGIAVGYVLGGMLMARRGPRYGVAKEHVWNMLTRAVIGVIVGARLFFVVGHFGEFWPNVADIFRIWQGGIVFYGGVFGGIVAAYPYMRKHGLNFWHVMDAAAPGFPLGLVFGRIGDLVIGDHLGGRTHFAFGFRYEGGQLPGCAGASPAISFITPQASCPRIGEVVHQTALYDLWNVLVLLPVVLWLARKRRPDGFLIMFTATWYGGVRVLTDFARVAPDYWGLRGTQWISIAIIVAGAWYLARLARSARPAEVEELGHS